MFVNNIPGEFVEVLTVNHTLWAIGCYWTFIVLTECSLAFSARCMCIYWTFTTKTTLTCVDQYRSSSLSFKIKKQSKFFKDQPTNCEPVLLYVAIQAHRFPASIARISKRLLEASFYTIIEILGYVLNRASILDLREAARTNNTRLDKCFSCVCITLWNYRKIDSIARGPGWLRNWRTRETSKVVVHC